MVSIGRAEAPREAGRDAHFAYGKFAVYPGNNFQTPTHPFIAGIQNETAQQRKLQT